MSASKDNNTTQKADTLKVFKTYDQDIPAAALIKKIHADKDKYARAKGLKGKKAQEFYQAIENITKGIDTGTLSRDVSNNYLDTSNTLVHRKQGYDGLTYAYNYLDALIGSYTPTEKKSTAPKKYSYNHFIDHLVNQISPGSDTIQTKAWLSEEQKNADGTYQIAKRKERFNNILTDYISTLKDEDWDYSEYGGLNAIKQRLQKAVDTTDNFRDELAAIGIGDASYEALFGTGQPATPVGKQTSSTDEQELAKLRQENAKAQATLKVKEDLENEKFKSDYLKYYTQAADTEGPEMIHQGIENGQAIALKNTGLSALLDNHINNMSGDNFQQYLKNASANMLNNSYIQSEFKKFYDNLPQLNLASQLLINPALSNEYSPSNYITTFYKHLWDSDDPKNPTFKERLTNGKEVLLVPYSMNIKENSFYYYDPETNAIYKDKLSNHKDLMKKYESTLTTKHASGGIIKAQPGTQIDRYGQWHANRNTKKQQDTTPKDTPAKESKKPSPKAKFDFDNPYVYALLLDAGSLLASVFPGVGNVIGGLAGFGGSTATLIGDLQDGFDWSDVGNFAFGLGMDALGLIPVAGAAAKMGKTAKTIAKALPIIQTGITGIVGYQQGSQIIQTLNNWRSGKDLTMQDYSNLTTLIKVLTGGASYVKNRAQTKGIMQELESKSSVKTPETFTVKNKAGKKFNLSKEEYTALLNAKTPQKTAETVGAINAQRKADGREDLLIEIDTNNLSNPKLSKLPFVDQRVQLDLEHKPEVNGYDFTRINEYYSKWDPRIRMLKKSVGVEPEPLIKIPYKLQQYHDPLSRSKTKPKNTDATNNTSVTTQKQGGKIVKAQTGLDWKSYLAQKNNTFLKDPLTSTFAADTFNPAGKAYAQNNTNTQSTVATGNGNVTSNKKGLNMQGISALVTTGLGALNNIASYINTKKANKKALDEYTQNTRDLAAAKLKNFEPEKSTRIILDPRAEYTHNAFVQDAFNAAGYNLTTDAALNRALQNNAYHQVATNRIATDNLIAQDMNAQIQQAYANNYENLKNNAATAAANKEVLGIADYSIGNAKIQHDLNKANAKNQLIASLGNSAMQAFSQVTQMNLENKLNAATTDEERQKILNQLRGIRDPYVSSSWSAKSGGKVEVAKIKRKTEREKMLSKELLEKMKLNDKKMARFSKLNAKLILKMLEL